MCVRMYGNTLVFMRVKAYADVHFGKKKAVNVESLWNDYYYTFMLLIKALEWYKRVKYAIVRSS